jgi:hypothetical protein
MNLQIAGDNRGNSYVGLPVPGSLNANLFQYVIFAVRYERRIDICSITESNHSNW